MNKTCSIIWLGLLASLTLVAQTASAPSYLKQATVTETGGKVHVVANSPRPLEQLLGALQKKYGWVINYEDPQYVAAEDIIERPGIERSKFPSGGNFSVDFPAGAPDEEKILRVVVDEYNKSKNPGRFEVRHGSDGAFYVVGTSARDEKGNIVQQQVPLDVPLTLTAEDQPLNEALDRICQETSKQSRFNLSVGITPRALLVGNHAKIGGVKVSARDLLLQALLATHEKTYWRLLFDPDSKSYVLNVHAVHT